MKKYLALLLMMALAAAPVALAEDAATPLPCGATFEMDGPALVEAIDEAATDMYVEYGMLDASWVKEDVRIYLSLQRMYEDYLELSFSPRICFDASDLDV